MPKFRKKPVQIEAIQWTGDNFVEIDEFIDQEHGTFPEEGYILIYTMEEKMKVELFDWIIKGVQGEFYPCKPDIFQETYESAQPIPALTFHIEGQPDTEWHSDLHPAMNQYMSAKEMQLKRRKTRSELGKGERNAFIADNGVTIWWESNNNAKPTHVNNDATILSNHNAEDEQYYTRTITVKVPKKVTASYDLGQVIGNVLSAMGKRTLQALPENDSRFYGKQNQMIHASGACAWVNKVEVNRS